MFWAWFVTPAGRRALLILGGLALVGTMLFAVYEHGRHEGLDTGRKEGTKDALDQSRQEAEKDRTAFLSQLSLYQQREEAANQILSQAAHDMAKANERLSTIQASRDRDTQALGKVADAELFTDITHKLALRSSTDTSPQLNIPELRRVDQAITDYPHALEEASGLRDKVAALDKKVGGLEDRACALEGQRDASIAYGNQMLQHYTTAYNAAEKMFQPSWFRKIITLGRAKAKHLNLPDPVSLRGGLTDVPKTNCQR